MRSARPLTVIVPVFNEGTNLRRWWALTSPYLPQDAEVRVVYDFDEDDTLPIAEELRREGARLSPLRNSGRGVLSAIVTGIRSIDFGPVLVSMADLSDDPASIPAMLLAYRAGADVVAASRFMVGGRMVGGPWLKGRLACWGGRSLRFLAGFPISDATNSFRLYDAALVRSIELESSGGFEVGFEITLKAWMLGRRVEEVPSIWRARELGASRFRLLRWLPHYGRLWWRAMLHGARARSAGVWGLR